MRAIVPIREINRRIPEAGRIRIGKKATTSTGKEAPQAIGEFRFTSHDSEALDQIAAMYGGTVRPWSDAKAAEGQFEVCTDASEIRIVLPPDPLGGSPIYELWGGGGCERRCDGETCTIVTAGPEGPEPSEIPCVCVAKQEMACKVTTHLAVLLPEVRFAGVWRLTTHSWNAVQELPGMVDMIQAQQGRGLSYATLAIKHRRSVQAGKTRKFLVPVLGVPASLEQLVSDGNRVGQIGAETPALPEPEPVDVDAEVIDAEVVDACPGCSEDVKDGRPVKKIAGVLWHSECDRPAVAS